MRKCITLTKQYVCPEASSTLVEYGLIAALGVILSVAGFALRDTNLLAIFNLIAAAA